MLKTIATLVRGAAADAEDAVFDANATRILTQNLRDAADAMEHAKRDLALAMAQRASEQRAIEAIDKRIVHLEQGAVDALGGERADLAHEAATMIAALEDERRERAAAMARFDLDIQRLQHLTETGRRRLADLKHGLEMARAEEALRRAGANGRRALASGTGALREAEATLAKIKETHQRSEDMHQALDELERSQTGRDLDQRLADAGFGPNMKTKADDVLQRLKRAAAARNAAPTA